MLFRPSQPDRGFEFLIKYVNVHRTTVDSLHIVVTHHRNEPFCRATNVARQGPTLRMNILLVAFTPCSQWGGARCACQALRERGHPETTMVA